jgi:hypothetical protein
MNRTTSADESESVDEKRAQYERMAFTVCRNGVVNVRNDSYGDDSGAHIYSVEVADGAAVGCSCPHAVHRGAHCKHQVAVENRPLVVSSASAAGATSAPVATDGGEVENAAGGNENGENGTESGSGTSASGDGGGTVDVHGCAACGGYAYGSDDFCSEECRERGEPDETPL